jgi:hypothetical protein
MRTKRFIPLRSICALLLALTCGASFADNLSSSSPNFSLTLSGASLALTSGGVAKSLSIAAKGLNGFRESIEVKVSGLPAGVVASPATFTLEPGAPKAIKFVAEPSAAGEATILFRGTSGSLVHAVTVALTIKVDVVMHHDDIGRTGLNANETILTPANVKPSKFGLLRQLPVDGVVDAEPLELSNLEIDGRERDVVYVVSEHDSVYAFDAATGARLWQHSVLGKNESTALNGCGQIAPEIGITSTPVIDRKFGPHGAIFVVGMSQDQAGNYHQRLHALDIVTGAELEHSPAEIEAAYPGTGANSSNGNVVFAPGQYAERVGLLLLNGFIYLGWTSHCDEQPYTAWLMAYNESTMKQASVLNLTPNGSGGGIWMAGSGLAADADGYIYFLDGNGTFDPQLNSRGFPVHGDFGNGFIKVGTANGKLSVADYFEMSNTVSESNGDSDLGSGGALVLPDLKDEKGNVHYLAVGGGKDQNIYVVNRGAMGKFNPNNDNAIYQEIDGANSGGVWSMPAYFNGTIYYGSVNNTLNSFPIVNARLSTAPHAQTVTNFEYPGTTPSISAHGLTNGIVWAVENSSSAVLHAYAAGTLVELYNSSEAAHGRDNFGPGNKFITPMIANGKVFVGTPSSVAVFGLLP